MLAQLSAIYIIIVSYFLPPNPIPFCNDNILKYKKTVIVVISFTVVVATTNMHTNGVSHKQTNEASHGARRHAKRPNEPAAISTPSKQPRMQSKLVVYRLIDENPSIKYTLAELIEIGNKTREYNYL